MKKLFTLLILLIAFSLESNAQSFGLSHHASTGCTRYVNIPAEFVTEQDVIMIPEQKILITPAVYTTKTLQVLIKEPAKETYYECLPSGQYKTCTRDLDAVYETYTYTVETVPAIYDIIPAQVIEINRLIATRDGYIAQVPCE